MKMLFVMPIMKYSGAPKMMATVANWFAENGEEVKILTFLDPEITQKLHENIKTDSLNFKRKKGKLGLISDYYNLRKQIIAYVLKEKPDVLMTFGDIFSTMTLKKLKKKGICTIVSERADPGGSGMIARYRRHAFGHASGLVFQTEGAKSCFKKAVQDKGVVIPNPVSVSNAECVPFAERKKKIVSVGRFDFNQKRQDLLIEAFKTVHEKHPDYTLYFYGDGGDLNKAKNLASTYGLAECIVFAGTVSPIEDYIKDATLMVLPSDFEGIPNAIIEAMNMNIPVISTDCRPGGARLLLGKDEFGLISPIGDSKALAEKICYALDNLPKMQEMSEQGKKSLARFEPETIANMWKTVVYEIKNKK